MMGLILRASTAASISVGPMVDRTDNYTPETALTSTGIRTAFKAGATAATTLAGTFTHRANGVYTLDLGASDVDTVGPLTIQVQDVAICRPEKIQATVLPTHVYDALVAGTDFFRADIREVNDNSTAAANLRQASLSVVTGTVSTGASTTSLPTDLTEATNDHYNGRTITFTSGALAGQSATISDYTGATKTLTVTALTEVPSNGDAFVIS